MNDIASHVPAPWEVCMDPKNDTWYRGQTIGAANESDGRRICDVWSLGDVEPGSIAEANARRIVACVNACEGISTESLESGEARAVRDELANIEKLESQRDQLLEFARDILSHWPDGGDLDGGDIQGLAVKHGLLIGKTVNAPCNAENADINPCSCAEFCDAEDFTAGVTCYSRAEFLQAGAA
jgi:hypothetical protein